jgi:hypothetical protein
MEGFNYTQKNGTLARGRPPTSWTRPEKLAIFNDYVEDVDSVTFPDDAQNQQAESLA